MAGALDGMAVSSRVLSYDDAFGVGYCTAFFTVEGRDGRRRIEREYFSVERRRFNNIKHDESDIVRLARKSLEMYVKSGRVIGIPNGLSSRYVSNAAGVFVSLKLDGELRGCIGTLTPTRDCIAEEVIYNAISAGAEDPRFEPVSQEELGRLVYSVDILGEPEPVSSESELDAAKYGVIVRAGSKCGVLLPDLPGVDTPEDQLRIAKSKAGIGRFDRPELFRFEVSRFK